MKKQIVNAMLSMAMVGTLAACSQTSLSLINDNDALSEKQMSSQQAVKEVMQRYQQAMRTANIDGIASTLHDDIVTTFQGKLTHRGKAEVVKGYQATFQAMDFSSIEYLIDSLNVDQNLAVVATYHAKGSFVMNKKTNKKVLDHNRELFVLKNEKGQWLISRYMYNQTPEQAK